MSKATITMPLKEYEELRKVIIELEQKVHEEYLRNEKYNKVLSKLGIDEVIFNEIINGAEVTVSNMKTLQIATTTKSA